MSLALASDSGSGTQAAATPSAFSSSSSSSAASLSAKIEALEGKLNKLESKTDALDAEIAAAEKAHDVAAVRLRNDRQELKEEAKQLRAMLIGYQNLLLEAQQRAQQQQPSAAATGDVALLTQQLANLATSITQQQTFFKRVLFQVPVEVRSFNSSDNFLISEYRNFGSLLAQTFAKFGIEPDRASDARFYWMPPSTADSTLHQRMEQRRTIRRSQEWEDLLTDWENLAEAPKRNLITLYFVTGDLSPSLVQRPPPPSPPDFPRGDEEKSEPASSHGLTSRDHGACVLCGHSEDVEAAHIVDKSRQELLEGAPDAPPIDDLRNLLQLCPNHHTSFDSYRWTLVPDRRQLQPDGEHVLGFWVRSTLVKAKASVDISRCMQTFIRFADPCPPEYSFLLKQLGRFPVPCRVCSTLFDPRSLPGHYGGKHSKNEAEKELWKDLPHLLPRPCACPLAVCGQTPWALYCHLLDKHSELLYI